MKKTLGLVLTAVAALAFWRRRRSSAPTARERLRARAGELVATERSRVGGVWQGVRDRRRERNERRDG